MIDIYMYVYLWSYITLAVVNIIVYKYTMNDWNQHFFSIYNLFLNLYITSTHMKAYPPEFFAIFAVRRNSPAR